MLVYGAGAAFFAWSRPNLVGAGAGSGTSDFPSRSHQKKWRLRNTAKKGQRKRNHGLGTVREKELQNES